MTALVPWGEGVVAGTYHGGLSWFDGRAFRIEREGRGGTLPAGWVNPHGLSVQGGQLFVSTLERGLLVGRRGSWTHLQMADGLPSDDVTDLLSTGPRSAWVATRGGLAHLRW